eukprot:6191925-Pleurochrysis_carterae.AAC.2
MRGVACSLSQSLTQLLHVSLSALRLRGNVIETASKRQSEFNITAYVRHEKLRLALTNIFLT